MKVSDRTRVFRKYSTDAGLDLLAKEKVELYPGETKPIPIGTQIVIPEGHVGFVVCRSSARRKGLVCFSVVDAFWEGLYEPFVTNTSQTKIVIEKNERVLQLIILPLSRVEVIRPDEEVRGDLGCGSTGK